MADNISITITGADVIRQAFADNNQALLQAVSDEIAAAALECQGIAKQNAPVGTPESTHKKGYHGGRLRQDIQVDIGIAEATVFNTVDYAPFVHDGTSKMHGRPYMFNAWEDVRPRLEAALKALAQG